MIAQYPCKITQGPCNIKFKIKKSLDNRFLFAYTFPSWWKALKRGELKMVNVMMRIQGTGFFNRTAGDISNAR